MSFSVKGFLSRVWRLGYPGPTWDEARLQQLAEGVQGMFNRLADVEKKAEATRRKVYRDAANAPELEAGIPPPLPGDGSPSLASLGPGASVDFLFRR